MSTLCITNATLRAICVCTVEVLSGLLHSRKRLRAFLSCRLWMGPWHLLKWMSQNIFVWAVVKREVDCASCEAMNSFSTPNNFSHSFWCNKIVIIVARFSNLKMLSVPNIKRCLSTSTSSYVHLSGTTGQPEKATSSGFLREKFVFALNRSLNYQELLRMWHWSISFAIATFMFHLDHVWTSSLEGMEVSPWREWFLLVSMLLITNRWAWVTYWCCHAES